MSPTNEAATNSPRVFISHSSTDEEYAAVINKKLRESGLDTYYAPESNRIGDEWQKKIKQEIQICRAVVLLISSRSQTSPWVDREVEYFTIIKAEAEKERQPKRELFPVILSEIKFDELDLEIRRLQCVDCSKVVGDPQRFSEKIDEVIAKIKKSFSIGEKNYIEIPVITFAMTNTQAGELIDEQVFMSGDVTPNDKKRYDDLKESLSKHGVTDMNSIRGCYGEEADDWCPLITNNYKPIKKIVEEIEDLVNSYPIMNDQHKVRTKLLSKRALDDPTKAPSLQHAQCILIVDAISLFHPPLFDKLGYLGLTQSKNTNLMMIVIPPIGHAEISIYKFLEKAYAELGSMRSAFKLFSEDFEIGYELGIGDRHSLPRWLKNNLTQVAIKGRIPNESKLGKFGTGGEDHAPFIFG